MTRARAARPGSSHSAPGEPACATLAGWRTGSRATEAVESTAANGAATARERRNRRLRVVAARRRCWCSVWACWPSATWPTSELLRILRRRRRCRHDRGLRHTPGSARRVVGDQPARGHDEHLPPDRRTRPTRPRSTRTPTPTTSASTTATATTPGSSCHSATATGPSSTCPRRPRLADQRAQRLRS